jgi:hypothetical protein
MLQKSIKIVLKYFKKSYTTAMDLKKVVQRLNQYASKDLACDWDNVGLLVEPKNVYYKRFN